MFHYLSLVYPPWVPPNLPTPTGVNIKDFFSPAARFDSLGGTASTLGKLVAFGGGLAVVAGFVYAAFLYLTAQGEAKKIQEAQQILTYGMIGLVLIGAAYWIVQIASKLLGQSGIIF